MARGYSQSRSEVMADESLRLTKKYGDRGVVTEVNGKASNDFFNAELAKKVSMTAADRMPEGSVRPWKHTDRVFSSNGNKLAPLAKELAGFANEGQDSLAATLAWRNNDFETMAFFDSSGKRLGTFSGEKTSVVIPGDAVVQLTRANGISIHNHPRADLTFSAPDLQNWLEGNYQEMMVISPKFAYSIRHGANSRKTPAGRADYSQFPEKVATEFDKILYSPKAIAETKLLVGKYGWNRKSKSTGVVEKVYGDTAEPAGHLVVTAHMERAMMHIAKKYGFEYTKYPLPE